MKKLLLFSVLLFSLCGYSQYKIKNPIVRQIAAGDTLDIKLEKDSSNVKFVTNKDGYTFDKPVNVAGVSLALSLGETDVTAYRGDRGKIAYDFVTGNYATKTDTTQIDGTDRNIHSVIYNLSSPYTQINSTAYNFQIFNNNFIQTAFVKDATENIPYIYQRSYDEEVGFSEWHKILGQEDKSFFVDTLNAQNIYGVKTIKNRMLTNAIGTENDYYFYNYTPGLYSINYPFPYIMEAIKIHYDKIEIYEPTDNNLLFQFNPTVTNVYTDIMSNSTIQSQGIYASLEVDSVTTAQSMTNGVWNKLTAFNVVGLKENCNAVADSIIIEKTGKYEVQFNLCSQSVTGGVNVETCVFINGVKNSIHTIRDLLNNELDSNVSCTRFVSLTAGDVLDVRVKHDNGAPINLTTIYGSFSVRYIGN